jgi:hypothetical protein
MGHKIDPDTGHRIEIDTETCTSFLVTMPCPFQMMLVPRSERRRSDIVKMWSEAEARDKEERAVFLRAARERCHL